MKKLVLMLTCTGIMSVSAKVSEDTAITREVLQAAVRRWAAQGKDFEKEMGRRVGNVRVEVKSMELSSVKAPYDSYTVCTYDPNFWCGRCNFGNHKFVTAGIANNDPDASLGSYEGVYTSLFDCNINAHADVLKAILEEQKSVDISINNQEAKS